MKVFKYVPFVSVILIVAMYVGLIMASKNGEIVNYNFVSTPHKWTAGSVLAMFGHHSIGHFLSNAIMFALFAIPAELLLGKVRFVAAVTTIMSVWMVADHMTQANYGIGASGWVYAMPGLLFIAAAWRNRNNEIGNMSMPVMSLAVSVTASKIDMAGTVGDGVGHSAHIIGHIMTAVMVLAAVPYMVGMVQYSWKMFRENMARQRRYAR